MPYPMAFRSVEERSGDMPLWVMMWEVRGSPSDYRSVLAGASLVAGEHIYPMPHPEVTVFLQVSRFVDVTMQLEGLLSMRVSIR